MAAKQDFLQDEWTRLLESSMLAGLAVTAAEPHGLWGTLEEGWASAKGLASGTSSSTELIKSLVADLGTAASRSAVSDAIKQRLKGATSGGEIVNRAIAELNEACKVVDAKAGADAAPFKQWLYGNAKRVAESASEGGFLGFGGVKVSEKEKATLAQVATALGLSPQAT